MMAKLTRQDVEHVARLAKLTLTKKEITKFLKELSRIVEYVGELREVDTSDTQPTSQTTGLSDITSEDKVDVSKCLTVKDALSGTDAIHNDFFVVPRILEK